MYWAASRESGFQFRFNKEQILYVVFIYLAAREGGVAIDRSLLDVEVFETFDEAEQASTNSEIPYRASVGEPGSSRHQWWIKLDHGNYTAHYQFQQGRVALLTLSAKTDA